MAEEENPVKGFLETWTRFTATRKHMKVHMKSFKDKVLTRHERQWESRSRKQDRLREIEDPLATLVQIDRPTFLLVRFGRPAVHRGQKQVVQSPTVHPRDSCVDK